MKRFHLGDVLSITTGALVSPDHIDGVYRILNYMTGDNLFTHQLSRASRECEPALLAQHPQLAGITAPEFTGDNADRKDQVAAWLEAQVALYGDYLDIAPLPEGDHTFIDPLTELRMMRPDAPIVVVEVPDSATGESDAEGGPS